MATQIKTGLIANDAITDAKIANVALTGVTASSGDSSTSLATTAFVTTEINSLIDSAPGALNTLNELAAAMGDDANFSTTVTNSIATKLPLAGGTLTGDITLTNDKDIHFLTNSGSNDGTMITRATGDALRIKYATNVLIFDAVDNFATRFYNSNGVAALEILPNATAADSQVKVNNGNLTVPLGNVGIGTNSPAGPLHVDGHTSSLATILEGNGNGDTVPLHFRVKANNNNVTNHGIFGNAGSTGADNSIHIGPSATSGLSVNADGHVGIGGTPHSSGRLLVSNGGTNQIVLKGASGSTNINMGNFVGGGYISNNYYYSSGHQADDNSKGAFEIFLGDDQYTINYHSAGAMGTRRQDFHITDTGNVGIGTNSPVAPLHVYNSSGGNATDKASMLSEAIVKLQPHTTNSTNMLFAQVDNGSSMGIQVTNGPATANWDIALSPFGGNVGIGTISPTLPLDVSAEIGSNIGQTSTHTYGLNRNWAMRTNNYGSANWGGWSLEQSTAAGGTPSVARIGVHLNGNVGINMGGDASTSLTDKNPATALHVGGDITVGSADSVGTSGTASIRFQNDNERSRITSNYASGGGGQMGFWTDTTGGTLVQRVTIKNDGTKVTNNVREYYERIYLTNNVAYTFDIDVKSIGASGQVLEVFAGYTHYSTAYAAVIKQVWTQRSTAQSDVVILSNTVSASSSTGGAWSFTYVDADTVRLTKSAGTYGGAGWGYILIRSPD